VEDVVKPEVGYVAKTINLEADQGKKDATRHIATTNIVDPDTEVIVINSSSSEPECSSTSELECSSTSKLEFLSFEELSSYLSSFSEFDSSDESGSLEKSVSGSLKKSVLQKGFAKWYENEKDEDEEEKDE
ncbi:hypothetical protein Tco_1267688, partial [Tanacetum coccineum]